MPISSPLIQVEVKNLEALQRMAEQMMRLTVGSRFQKALSNVTLLVMRTAAGTAYVPVDTGRLRASITPEIRVAGNDVFGVVGSNVEYAPWTEFGTYTAKVQGGPHWLQRAFEDNENSIYLVLGDVLMEIIDTGGA